METRDVGLLFEGLQKVGCGEEELAGRGMGRESAGGARWVKGDGERWEKAERGCGVFGCCCVRCGEIECEERFVQERVCMARYMKEM